MRGRVGGGARNCCALTLPASGGGRAAPGCCSAPASPAARLFFSNFLPGAETRPEPAHQLRHELLKCVGVPASRRLSLSCSPRLCSRLLPHQHHRLVRHRCVRVQRQELGRARGAAQGRVLWPPGCLAEGSLSVWQRVFLVASVCEVALQPPLALALTHPRSRSLARLLRSLVPGGGLLALQALREVPVCVLRRSAWQHLLAALLAPDGTVRMRLLLLRG